MTAQKLHQCTLKRSLPRGLGYPASSALPDIQLARLISFDLHQRAKSGIKFALPCNKRAQPYNKRAALQGPALNVLSLASSSRCPASNVCLPSSSAQPDNEIDHGTTLWSSSRTGLLRTSQFPSTVVGSAASWFSRNCLNGEVAWRCPKTCVFRSFMLPLQN